jgi:hypothetical protein
VIYAIRAVGTEFVKVGKANSVGKRLKELEVGSPHELHIEAVADWHDAEERRLHRYLRDCCVRGEWFKDSPRLDDVVRLMRSEDGLEAWRAICESLGWVLIIPEPQIARKHPKRKDTRFFDPRPILSAAEKRKLEREAWWQRQPGSWKKTKKTYQQSASPISQPPNSAPSSTKPCKAMEKASQFTESLMAWESSTLLSIANSSNTERQTGETLRSQEP